MPLAILDVLQRFVYVYLLLTFSQIIWLILDNVKKILHIIDTTSFKSGTNIFFFYIYFFVIFIGSLLTFIYSNMLILLSSFWIPNIG